MIDASILLKNKNDRHLNVFWQYDGRPWLENNITKAFINTFESLDIDSKKNFILDFFDINLSVKDPVFKLYLQTSPGKDEIKSIKESNRLLFAFSPTGKPWGAEGIATNDSTLIESCIRRSLIASNPEKEEKEINKLTKEQVEDTLNVINGRGESIPDAWIMICEKDKPMYCIAMENKLYDLDPFQLNNHCVKSLFMTENRIKFAKYTEILEELNKLHGYLVDDFLRYMYFLNYWSVNNLSQLKGMDEEHIKLYANERCRQLLTEVSNKEVTKHKGWMYNFSTDNDYNRLIGMEYKPELNIFSVAMYFGSTQNSSRGMYKMLKEHGYNIDNKYSYRNSFHFQQIGTSKNVIATYYKTESFDIEKYINFWTKNSASLFQMDKANRAKLLNNML